MRRLVNASMIVGAVGAAVALPLLGVLSTQFSPFANPLTREFYLSAPAVLFVLAAAFFALVFPLLPVGAMRARIAGVLAAVLTYVAFTLWAAYWIVSERGLGPGAWLMVGAQYLLTSVFVGWVPLLGGLFAGALASRWLQEPANAQAQ